MIWRSLLLTLTIVFSSSSITAAKGQTVTKADCVILLHGLGRTHRSMNKIGKHLRANGYFVVNKGYNSREATIPILAKSAVETALQACPSERTTHVVTHSMGGILLRQYLSTRGIPRLGNVVMLSPPNQGSEVVDRTGNWLIYKQILGPAGRQLRTDGFVRNLPPADFTVGIITGNRTVNPVLSTMFNGENDGKVSVESSKLEGMTDHIVMPVNHTFMMRDKRVLQQIDHFLKFQRFE